MKKIILSLSFIAALILVILSCRKNLEPTDSLTGLTTMNQNNQNIEQRILTYRSALESGLKSGNDYPIDTAVWYTEALINFTYADVTNNLEGLYVDSVFVDVGLSDGKVTLAEAASVYDDIIDSLTVQYENLPSQNLHLIFADVFSLDSTAGHVTFGVISAFGFGTQISYGDFDSEDDYWIYGNAWCDAGGYCYPSPLEGTQTDDDAAEQIERRIRMGISVPLHRNYALGTVTLEILGDGSIYCQENSENYTCFFRNPSDSNPPDNYYDYYIMFQMSSLPQTFHDCLCPTEMNFYLDSTSYVSYEAIFECDEVEDLIEGKELTSIDIIGKQLGYGENYFYIHYVINSYGTWIETQVLPEEF